MGNFVDCQLICAKVKRNTKNQNHDFFSKCSAKYSKFSFNATRLLHDKLTV